MILSVIFISHRTELFFHYFVNKYKYISRISTQYCDFTQQYRHFTHHFILALLTFREFCLYHFVEQALALLS